MVVRQNMSNRCHRSLNKVSRVSTASNVLGMPSSLPVFISPAALARLGHPNGEMNLVRAAGKAGILQGVRHEVRIRKRD
jgi:L-lactate dehydrogenase (cytochrome)